jgi:uncharacterized protein YcbK (DUF882 family)
VLTWAVPRCSGGTFGIDGAAGREFNPTRRRNRLNARALHWLMWHLVQMHIDRSDPGTGNARRRRFLLQAGAGVALLAAGQARLLAASTDAERKLSFVHTHTGERLSVTYFQAGVYDQAALARVNVLLRDFRTEKVHAIDPQLLDVLYALQCRCSSDEAFEIISGYRSPATNAMLRSRSRGVAEHSLHMDGRAIDIRLRGQPTRSLAILARQLSWGGVGYYRVSDFVHVDTGRVRVWGDPVGA